METALRGHLAAAAPIANLVGTDIRWGERATDRSVALHLITAPPDAHLTGYSGLVLALVQIDCWWPDYDGAKALGEAVKAALPTPGQVIGGIHFQGAVLEDEDRRSFGDDPNKIFRTRLDVRVTFSQA